MYTIVHRDDVVFNNLKTTAMVYEIRLPSQLR